MKGRFYILILLNCLSVHAQSYQLSFQHVNTSNELPDAEISCLYEHNHLLYIGTEDGLYAFNGGSAFKIPLEVSGEKVNVTSIIADSLGNLWIGSQNGLYIYNKEEKTTRIQRYGNSELNYMEAFYCDKDGNVWLLSGADNNAIVTYNIYSTKLRFYGDNFNSVKAVKAEKGALKEIWFKETKGAYRITLNKEKTVINGFVDGENGSEICNVNDIYVDADGTALLSTEKGIKIISSFDLNEHEKTFQALYPGNVLSTAIHDNVLFISTATGGLIVFDIPHQREITRFKKDPEFEGSMGSNTIKFVRIFNRCLYIVNNNNTVDYCGLYDNEFSLVQSPEKAGGFHDIAIYRNRLWLVGNDSSIYEMGKNEFNISTEINSPVQRIQAHQGKLYTMNGNILKEYSGEQSTTYIFENSFVTNIYGVQTNGDSLYANTNSGLYQLTNGKVKPFKGLQDEVYRWYEHMLFINQTTVLVNAYYSYFLLVRKKGDQYVNDKLVLLIEKVNQLRVLKNATQPDKILIVTDDGISTWDPKNDSIKKIKTSGNTKQYRIANEGLVSLLLITIQGVEDCYFSGDTLKTFHSKTNIPVESIENNDVASAERKLYIPLKNGVLVYDEQNKYSGDYKLHINNIIVSNKVYRTNWQGDTIRSRYSKSELSMDIGLWSSHIHQHTSIKYFLSEKDAGSVIEGRKSNIYFEKISPGTHTLTIQALDRNGEVLATEKITIIIEEEWYQTGWFYLGIVFIILLTGYLLFRWRLNVENRKTRKQELMLRRIKESENLALRSQMNPHFIFNTLNSINTYILNEDNENASSYLTMFSKLIRSTLDLTRSEKVTLEQEISTLKLYMDIEKSRTNFKFDYQINIDKNIDPHFTKVPPLIIQPFVENSIWHGIQGLEGRGLIDIEIISTEEELVTIRITDNGIGRKEVKAAPTTRISHGLAITSERLSIWNEKSHFEITDLTDEKGKPSGTQVIIYLYY